MTSPELTVAVVQMQADPDPIANLATLRACLSAGDEASTADLVVIPEYALCCGSHSTVRSMARSVAEWRTFLARLVDTVSGTVVVGGIPVLRSQGITDSAAVFDSAGEIVEVYDKIHLFEYAGKCQNSINESALFSHGDRVCTINVKGWSVRLSICFDVRFPELFRLEAGYDVALCTAAFTDETGRAHWSPLLRTRAIENQCFVVAAGLCGTNQETGVEFHGHSCVIDPWGDVLQTAGRLDSKILTCRLRRSQICDVRKRLPALTCRLL